MCQSGRWNMPTLTSEIYWNFFQNIDLWKILKTRELESQRKLGFTHCYRYKDNSVVAQHKNVICSGKEHFVIISSQTVKHPRDSTLLFDIVFTENCFRAILKGFHPFLISDCVPNITIENRWTSSWYMDEKFQFSMIEIFVAIYIADPFGVLMVSIILSLRSQSHKVFGCL